MGKVKALLVIFVFLFGALLINTEPASAIEQQYDYKMAEKINKAIADLENKSGNVKRQAKKELIDWGEASVEPLLEVVKNWREKDPDLRVECVNILGEIKDKRAVPVIISVLNEKHMTMRYSAARSLGKIGDNRATPDLIKLLEDPESEVRFYTAEAIGNIGDEQASKPLANVVLNDSTAKVRLAAITALDKVGGKSESKAVIDALADSDPDVRGYAAELAASWAIQEGLPIITRMIKEDRANIARAACARALGVYNDITAVPSLIVALDDGYSEVKLCALNSLKKISGQNYGNDKAAWNHWFELNKDKAKV